MASSLVDIPAMNVEHLSEALLKLLEDLGSLQALLAERLGNLDMCAAHLEHEAASN